MKNSSVIIAGVINVFLQALIPIMTLPTVSWYNFLLPAVSAVLIFLSKNLTGKGWTISGQFGATIASFAVSHPTPDGLTVKFVLATLVLPAAINALGILFPNGTTPDQPKN